MPDLRLRITADTDGVVKSIQNIQAVLATMASQAQAAGGKIDGAFAGAGAGANAAATATERLAGSETRAAAAAGNVAREMQNTAGSARNAEGAIEGVNDAIGGIDSLATKAGAALAGMFAVEKVKEFLNACIEVRSEFESLEISFSTLLGSDAAGKKMFKELTDFATSTPLMEKDIAKAAQTMLAFNISGEKVIPLLKAIGDVSMGSAEKFQSLVLSFAQATSLGKLQGGDLLQMVNAGFNPLVEMARTTGKSMTQLRDEMSKGAISAQMLEDAYISVTSEGGKFNGMLEKQSKTMAGALSNAEGAFQKFQAAIGEAMQPVYVEILNGAYDTLNEITEAFEEADIKLDPQIFKEVGVAIEGLITAFGVYKAATIAVTLATNAYAAAQAAARVEIGLAALAGKALSATQVIAIGTTNMLTASLKAMSVALISNPFTIAAAAVAAYVGAIVYATQKQESLKYSLKEEADVHKKAAEACTEEQAKIEDLRKTVESETKTRAERKKAVDELQKMYPEYFGKLSQEQIMCGEVGNAYVDLANKILKAAEARAAFELMAENDKERLRLQTELDQMDSDAIKKGQKLLKLQNELSETQIYTTAGAISVNGIYQAGNDDLSNSYIKAARHAGALHNAILKLVDANKRLADTAAGYKPEELTTPKTTTTTGKKTGNGKQKTREEIQAEIAQAQNDLDKVNSDFEEKIKEITTRNADLLAEMYGKVLGNVFAQQRYSLEEENAKNLAAIEQQAEAQKKAILKGLEDAWNAQEKLNKANAGNGKYVIKPFDFDNLSEEVRNEYTNMVDDINHWQQQAIDLSNQLFTKQLRDLQENAFADLLDQFGDYNEKRLQIERRYDKALKQLNDARAVAELENVDGKNDAMLARIDSAISNLKVKLAEELAAFDFSQYQSDMNIGEIVGSVQGYSSEGLEKMATALRKVVEANNDLSPEGLQRLQTLNDALTQIYSAQATQTPVEALKRSLKDFDVAKVAQETAQKSAEAAGAMTYEGSTLAARYAEAVATANEPLIQRLQAVETAFVGADGKALTYGQLLKQVAKTSKDVSIATERVRTATDACSKAWQKQSTAISKAVGAIKAVGSALQEFGKEDVAAVLGAAADLGDAVMSAINDIKSLVTNSAEAMTKTGKAAFMALSTVEKASVILTIVSVALQVITKIFSVAKEMHNSGLQETIDRTADKIERLQRAYDDLEDAADSAFSKERVKLIAEENQNLQRQNQLINQQILLEKQMKEDDEERQQKIKDYQETIRENEKLMAENKAAMQDAIFGEDIQSAIEKFADAYLGALSDGTSVKKAAKQMVIDMMKSMITESMKADLATPMQNLRNKMEAMYADNIISDDEQHLLEAEAEKISQTLKDKWAWANKLLQEDTQAMEGTSRGWATASQESIDELNGRFAQSQSALQGGFAALLQGNTLLTAINSSLAAVNGGLDGLQLLAVQANDHLENIGTWCQRIAVNALPRLARIEQKVLEM